MPYGQLYCSDPRVWERSAPCWATWKTFRNLSTEISLRKFKTPRHPGCSANDTLHCRHGITKIML